MNCLKWGIVATALVATMFGCSNGRDRGPGTMMMMPPGETCTDLATQLEGCGRAAAVDAFLDECGRDPAAAEARMPSICGGVVVGAGESCVLNAECGDGPTVCRPITATGADGRCLPLGGVRHALPEGTCGDLCDSAFDCGSGLTCATGMCLPDGATAAPVIACRGFEPASAIDYLASRQNAWMSERSCGMTCHTGTPFMLTAELHTTSAQSVASALVAQTSDRAANWDSIAVWYNDDYGAGKTAESRGTEAVLNAVAILKNDALAGSGPSVAGRQALDVLWAEQAADGGWSWLNFGLIPWETREARASGMAWAAIAAASLGEEYLTTTAEPDATGLAQLREGLRRLQTAVVHDQLMLLWAASEWPGLLTDEETATIVANVKALQLTDGGYNLGDLGEWRVQPGYPVESSTAYGTALATYALVASGVSPSDPSIVRSCEWLLGHQDPSGAFGDTSMNRDMAFNHDLITDAATAMSVLALTAATGG